jgi:hypothetical protein
MLIYIGFAYFNAFRSGYSLSGTLLRILGVISLLTLEFMLFLILLVGYYTHWEYSEVIILPFE